nr:MAG TPA: hypothetical protein [Microviridae sp.]
MGLTDRTHGVRGKGGDNFALLSPFAALVVG